jgi:hypothetical protein
LDLDKFSTISLAVSNFLSSKKATPYFSIASLKILADSDSASALITVIFFSSSAFFTTNFALNLLNKIKYKKINLFK